METEKTTPTIEQARVMQYVFDLFNDNLFAGALPQVIMNFSRSSKRTVAFFAPERWKKPGGEYVHEISLCPRFLDRGLDEIFSSLVHEQCHLWQHRFGKPSRGGYHNRQWAEKMIEIGLQPKCSSGGDTGQSCSHEIIPHGKFLKVFEAIDQETVDMIKALEPPILKAKQTRVKYLCEKCTTIIYGKPSLNLVCGDCNVQYKLVI
jgi:predicted SprT family Zn-dependent metalloprotease